MKKLVAILLAAIAIAAASGTAVGYRIGILDIYRNANFLIDEEMLLIELHGDWNEVFYGHVEG